MISIYFAVYVKLCINTIYWSHEKYRKEFPFFDFWKNLSEIDIISSLNIWKNLEVKPYRHGDLFVKSAQP